MELTSLDLRFPAVLSVGLLVALAATYAVHRHLSRRSARETSAAPASVSASRGPNSPG